MSKNRIIEIWNNRYGNTEEIVDYAGRVIKKSACGNPNSKFHPTLDHIRPLSKGGRDILENIVICHRYTNEEKSDRFPHWTANGTRFIAFRVRGTRNAYKIYKE